MSSDDEAPVEYSHKRKRFNYSEEEDESDVEEEFSQDEEDSGEEEEDLAMVSFERLAKMKRDGTSLKKDANVKSKTNSFSSTRDFSKGAPVEKSSKVPVARYRPTIGTKQKAKPRDPRFDPNCGRFNEGAFSKSFGFLEGQRNVERAEMAKMMMEEEDEERKSEIKQILTVMSQQDKEKKKKEEDREKKRKWRQEEQNKVSKGKKPFFQTKRNAKKEEHAQKIQKLEESGGLEAYLKKQHMKNVKKDARFAPKMRNIK